MHGRSAFAALCAFGLMCASACSDAADGEQGDGRAGPRGPQAGGSSSVDGGGFGNPTPRDVRDAGAGDAGTGSNGSLELTLEPQRPTLRVVRGEPLPSLQFTVANRLGSVDATFRVEKGALGRIDDTGLFTASGIAGGTTLVEARAGARVLHTELTIEIEWVQNGAEPVDPNALPSGGYGGVGGEGPGDAVDDALREALDGSPGDDPALQWLYPYDRTVFPLDMLAPLLMWTADEAAAADGISLHLSGPNFDYRGYFGRPPALTAGAEFVRHPIPQDVWQAATQTVAGGALQVELVVAQDGKAFGPIARTLVIADGSLKGTVYYQSYGTNLAKNYGGAIGGDGRFGGATLAIRPGAIEPVLVAGGTGGHEQCRVCHSVSSDGSRMTVQHGDDYSATSSYDLLDGNTETVYALRSQLAWIGMTPDGAFGLANGEPLAVGGNPQTRLYDMDTEQEVPTRGLTEFVREAAFPAFSHDGTRVAFNFFSGDGNTAIGPGDGRKLVAMDVDPATNTFGNPQLLYDGEFPAGWPSFSPGGTGVFFQRELHRHNAFFETRYGSTGDLWWTSLRTGEARALDRANGMDSGQRYLPIGGNGHETDEVLNYEPSMAPVASGGYAWMVFTSRRLYGNVATIDPWASDPREHDLTERPTPKKLWVAAIDLDIDAEVTASVAEDPSHPAFYLPGQELLAGNARGFWVVDPCKDDGQSCESGVECCSGYCQADDDGQLTCGRKTDECVDEFDRCETKADCCDPNAVCLNNVCSRLSVE